MPALPPSFYGSIVSWDAPAIPGEPMARGFPWQSWVLMNPFSPPSPLPSLPLLAPWPQAKLRIVWTCGSTSCECCCALCLRETLQWLWWRLHSQLHHPEKVVAFTMANMRNMWRMFSSSKRASPDMFQLANQQGNSCCKVCKHYRVVNWITLREWWTEDRRSWSGGLVKGHGPTPASEALAGLFKSHGCEGAPRFNIFQQPTSTVPRVGGKKECEAKEPLEQSRAGRTCVNTHTQLYTVHTSTVPYDTIPIA